MIFAFLITCSTSTYPTFHFEIINVFFLFKIGSSDLNCIYIWAITTVFNPCCKPRWIFLSINFSFNRIIRVLAWACVSKIIIILDFKTWCIVNYICKWSWNCWNTSSSEQINIKINLHHNAIFFVAKCHGLLYYIFIAFRYNLIYSIFRPEVILVIKILRISYTCWFW